MFHRGRMEDLNDHPPRDLRHELDQLRDLRLGAEAGQRQEACDGPAAD